MKRLTVILLCLAFLLSFAACGGESAPDTTGTIETTVAPETTAPQAITTDPAPQLTTYPYNVRDEYLNYAVSEPQIIYKTTASENGLAGNIYAIEGTLHHVETSTDETGKFTYKDAIVYTESGAVKISNMFATIYNATASEYGESAAKNYYIDDVSDYVFPAEGETAEFICIYVGYSLSSNLPVFYLGASPDLYMMAELKDPVSGISINPDIGSITDPTGDENTPIKTDPAETKPPETNPPKQDEPTTGEANALSSAKDYLRLMPFSYGGLVDQLEYEGYTSSEAKYAADHCGADWNEQALDSAQDYIDLMAFSYSGLIEQLEYDQYTHDQAKYGADNCGADWYEQAAKSAEAYLSIMTFSRTGLIEQLEYDGFTHDQAVYGVEENGL